MTTTTQQRQMPHTGNGGLFWIGVAFYTALTLLFAWQTWQFVNWLFPEDQIIMKILTVVCFDLMAVFWGSLWHTRIANNSLATLLVNIFLLLYFLLESCFLLESMLS